ncbi:MAG TPA: proton-conducting transporter membrane subunit [Clostridia bacterium]|nr:proton-conducting transporter membrane subunit [Clostridia bacterium]
MYVLSVLGLVILVVFELLALKSQKLMRLLVFSSIAEVGYIILGLGTGTFSGQTGALLHLSYQFLMRGLVFAAAAAIIVRGGSQSIEKLRGMGRTSPFLTTMFAFGIFSVMGLSPFKGSISKFLIVYSNIEKGYYVFAVLAIIGSVIEAWYFINVIQSICFKAAESEKGAAAEAQIKNAGQKKMKPAAEPAAKASKGSMPVNILIVLLGLLTALASLFPESIVKLAEDLAAGMFGISNPTPLPVFDTPWPILVLVPYIGAFAVFIIGHFIPKLTGILAVGIAAATVCLAWFDGSIDGLSRLFTLIISFVVLMASLYSIGYFKGETNNKRYFFFLLLTLGSLIGVAVSTQFGNFYVFWELMTWASYLMIVHEPTEKALKAGFKYFMMCATGAYFMQFGILMLHNELGTFDMNAVSSAAGSLPPAVLLAVVLAFVIGTGVKAGLVPMHSWLPEAHPAAPSPVSSLLSGILTKIGIYGLIRVLFAVFGVGVLAQLGSAGKLSGIGLLISVLGIATLLYGEIMALLQKDIKRLLAYSTMAQIGEITTTLGLGTYLSLVAGLYHVVNHAAMKGMLFLAVGILIHTLKTQEIVKLKGIGKVMPVTCGCMSIGILALMGLPPFGGFISKFLMLYAAVSAGYWYFGAFILLGSIIGAIYYIRLIRTIFFEKYEGPAVKEAPLVMLIPVMILTAVVVLNGLFPQYALNLVKAAADYVAAQGGMAVTTIPQIVVSWPVIVAIPMLGGLFVYFLGKRSKKTAGWISVAVMTASLAAIAVSSGRLDIFALSFALLIAFVALLNLLYSLGYMSHGHAQNRYYMFFIMMVGGLIGVATSKDMFAFFIFWEIMSSWTLYFSIIHEETQDALKEGFKYFIFNYIGASFAFLGMVMITANAGTFDIAAIAAKLGSLPVSVAASGIILLTVGFLMKAAVLPFRIDFQMHPATAPTPVSGYISSVLLKSAPYWLIRLLFIMGGAAMLGKLGMSGNTPVLMYVVSWIAGLTIIGAGAMALVQRGIKRLLIYSTVSQIGYIVLGLSLGTTLGMSGGLLHFINHMFFKDLLFLCAGAIMVQAHVTRLDEVGGLGRKMPFTLSFFMVGALSLAGIPPFSGFTSKWLIYEACMQQGQVFLALLSLAGSVLTMGYFLKFMHSAFFGTLPKKLENVKEAPWTMLVPMGILSAISLVLGVVPGLPLTVISKVLDMMNIPRPEFTLFGINTPLGAWQTGVVVILMLMAGVIGIGLFLLGNRKVRRTNAYTCGVSDITNDDIHVSAGNLYESPDEIIEKVHDTVVVPVFGNGEEVQK